MSFDLYQTDAPFFFAKRQTNHTLHDFSLSVEVGEFVAVVGASGAGKTVLADCIMGRFAANEWVQGSIAFEGKVASASELAALRGNGISLVPQSITHLNPLMPVGPQVIGVARGKTKAERAEDLKRRHELQRKLFATYGLAPEVALMYPHQLSGGMARRILLMCALMEEPRLILADEPTPGLDLNLALQALQDLKQFSLTGGSVLLITHDIELALKVADRVVVVRDGRLVEVVAKEAFDCPELLKEPYTRALWRTMPEHGMQLSEAGEACESEENHGS